MLTIIIFTDIKQIKNNHCMGSVCLLDKAKIIFEKYLESFCVKVYNNTLFTKSVKKYFKVPKMFPY